MFLKTIKKGLSKYIKKHFVRYLWTVDALNGVDTLTKKTVNYIPKLHDHLIISGWLFDAKKDNTIDELSIEIDGKSHHSLYGLIRTDVSFEYKDRKFRNSGFRCVIPKEYFQDEKSYEIHLCIRTRQKKQKTIKTTICFAISEEKTRGLVATSDEKLDYSQYYGEVLALKYIAGTGVEIGALHAPLSVDHQKAQVLYVDRMSQKDLYEQYPEFKKYDLVDADIIDNGDELSTIADNSFDFCISNHVLEHLEDPLKALCNWIRILKTKGILYLSIPLPYNIVDKHRQPTPISHIIDDYGLMEKDGQKFSQLRRNHFLDFAQSTNFGQAADEVFLNNKADELMAMNYSIHFHVFSEETLLQMMDFVARKIAIKIVEFVKNEPEEYILIIEKQDVA